MRRTVTVLVLVFHLRPATFKAAFARPEPTDDLGIHIVRRGQTLLCIARAYGVRWRAIALRNHLANPNRIYVGQRLVIPNAHGPDPAGPVCTRQFGGGSTPGCACSTFHTVTPGQTLYGISRWYGTNMWHIARCNAILNLNRIYAGQRLCIP